MTRRITIPAGVAVAAVLTFLISVPADAGCLKCRVKGYVNAVNEQDLEKSAGCFADQVTLTGPGSSQVLDRAAVRGLLGWSIATHTHVTIDEIEWEDETVRGRFTERNDFYDLIGVEAVQYAATFRFVDERIAEVHIEPLADDREAVAQAMRPFWDWALVRHGAEPVGRRSSL